MNLRKALEWGGLAAGAILVAFGIAAIAMGFNGRSTVRDNLKQEKIVFGDASDPSVPKGMAGKLVDNGDKARAFANMMREHALAATGGLTYSQMGRYLDAKGNQTNDASLAAKDAKGNPVENEARSLWVTETALSTALNMSYMAEQVALFGIVVGVALLLTGIGFLILALGGALRRVAAEAAERAPTPAHPAGA